MVYFIYNPDTNKIKIGYTKSNPQKRLNQLSTGSSSPLSLIGILDGNKDLEFEFHKRYAYLNYNLEWFSIDENLLDEINSKNEMQVYVDWLDDKLIYYKKIKL